jgi:uncharacterized Zn finger protein
MVLSGDYPRCPICGCVFDDLSVLKEGNNTLTCDDCGIEFSCIMSTSVEYDTKGGE